MKKQNLTKRIQNFVFRVTFGPLRFVVLAGVLTPVLFVAAQKAVGAGPTTPVLSDIALLKAIGVAPLATQPATEVGYAELTAEQKSRLTEKAHEWNRCGGYEDLTATNQNQRKLINSQSLIVKNAFGDLARRTEIDRLYREHFHTESVQAKPEIAASLDEVSVDNLKSTVEFLSGYHDRYNAGQTPNDAVEALKARLETLLKTAKIPYQIELINHQSTPQKSLHVRLPGALRPNEIVVLGAHLDSINTGWWGSDEAPGADDNASGTANLIEAMRILITKAQPERTLDFMWYAGEESGLLGSAEIAKAYKDAKADVVGVLQLDMTLYPGDGEMTLGSMNDFTSAWMRDYLVSLNSVYMKVKIIDDKCGYGCSDHASWHRQGYPALMPFEASFNGMNRKLHTADDKINSQSSFQHSAIFAKIALAIAMDLGNSQNREPTNPGNGDSGNNSGGLSTRLSTVR